MRKRGKERGARNTRETEQGAEGKGSNRRWILTSLRVLEAKRRAGKSERTRIREKALAARQPITETRNELRSTLEHCFAAWTLIRYGREKSISLETDVLSIVKNSSGK